MKLKALRFQQLSIEIFYFLLRKLLKNKDQSISTSFVLNLIKLIEVFILCTEILEPFKILKRKFLQFPNIFLL